MRFLMGLAIGGGIGDILGTRDGRERYEEIVAGVSDLVGEEMVAQVTEFLDQGASQMRKAASEATDSASEVIDATSDSDDD